MGKAKKQLENRMRKLNQLVQKDPEFKKKVLAMEDDKSYDLKRGNTFLPFGYQSFYKGAIWKKIYGFDRETTKANNQPTN